MPKIKEYTSQINAPGPQDRRRPVAEDFGSGEGLVRFGQGLSDFGDKLAQRQEQVETSELNAKMSKTQADWAVKINERVRAGNLDSEKTLQEIEEDLSKMEEGVQTRGGQAYFNQAAARLKGHFLETANASAAELAGQKAKNNYLESFSSQSSALISDPSAFEITKGFHDDNLDEMVRNGSLPAMAAEELKRNGATGLAKSSIKGWIKLNPDRAKADLDSGLWDSHIDGQIKDQMYGEIDQAKRAKDADDIRKLAEFERVKKERQELTQNKFLEALTKNELTAKDILDSDLDAFGSGSKQQFIEMMKTNSEQRIKTDASVKISLFDKIHSGEITDENKLNQFFGRGLTMEDLNQLRGEIQGKKTIDGSIESDLKKGVIDIAKGKLSRTNPMLGIRDPQGDERLQRFQTYFLTEFKKQKEAGKTAQQLLSPDSPDYLGKQIDRYTGTPQEIIKDITSSMKAKSKNSPYKDLEPTDIMKYTLEELQKMDPNALNSAQKEAARKRYNQLNGGQ